MATHYKFYDGLDESIVPWTAQYDFPSQANKALKVTTRISPSSGSQAYTPGSSIRINVPAQGYMNCLNTVLEFDLTMIAPATIGTSITRMQNNIGSIFSRITVKYGSLPFEDITYADLILRGLTEWTDGGTAMPDQDSIANGIGNVTYGPIGTGAISNGVIANRGLVNVRQAYIQGIDNSTGGFGFVPNKSAGQSNTTQTNVCTRRYAINIPAGLMLQDKLMPMKWMASQFQFELTLATPAACMFTLQSFNTAGAASTSTTDPSYVLSNVNLITEILEFDASYDVGFLEGLQADGCPIKYCSWHNFTLPITSNRAQVTIQEKARSIKGIVVMQQRSPLVPTADSGAMVFSSSGTATSLSIGNNATGTLQDFQFRAGSRWYPSQPVQCSLGLGSTIPNGGAEAWVEMQKFLNTLGDSRVKTANNTLRWAMPDVSLVAATATTGTVTAPPPGYAATNINEMDFSGGYVTGFANTTGLPNAPAQTSWVGTPNGTSLALYQECGNVGSTCFACATSFESSNGKTI